MTKLIYKKNNKAKAEIQNIDELEFTIFCIENIAEELNINGNEVYSMLTEKSDLLFSYIPYYNVLHTQSKEYIINDIIDFMKEYLICIVEVISI